MCLDCCFAYAHYHWDHKRLATLRSRSESLAGSAETTVPEFTIDVSLAFDKFTSTLAAVRTACN